MTKIKTKHLQEFKDKEVPIVEIFGNTLQGEGPRLRPAIFIRTGLCNFTCAGFGCEREAPDGSKIQGCDSIMAVSKKFKNTWTHYSNFNDIVNRIKPLIHPDQDIKQDIIITGGEPTLHIGTQCMESLLEYYISRGHWITIETNGSRMVNLDRDYHKQIQFSMSVKLNNSGEPKKKRINIPAIQNMIANGKESYLKFVVNPETWDADYLEIQEILKELPTLANVYLMPIGETRDKQIQNTQFVFDKCAEHGFNFSSRVHILAYNDKDGV